uniref:uncharacterized protein LOC122580039 n=1 Tax=Erigeron canadensis TaxID=72917 RepID=UPI001CB89DAC|nr:uncharacterized protein LOC122580039 [Erigeron canadensis]
MFSVLTYYSYSNILAEAESWMRTWGLSVEDLKSGTTFYSFLENGKTMDGKDITKAEGLRMINQINRDSKKKVDELFKDRKEGQSRLDEIHRSYLRLEEQEKKEKEEDLKRVNRKLKLPGLR